MPPDYIVYDVYKGKNDYFAVYSSGLVRNVASDERTYLRNQLGVPQITSDGEYASNRLHNYDWALQGKKTD